MSRFAIIAILFFALSARAADWPQFAGPARNATSPETGLMKTWPASGPKELWKVEVGPGFGGVAVENGEVFLLDRVPETADLLRCFDLKTGKELWSFKYDAPGTISHPGSRSHPSVDADYVFTMGPFGDLHCISRKSHKPVWRKNILKEFGAPRPHWAMSQCPALYQDLVVVTPVGTKAGMVAYHRKTGEVAWTSEAFTGKAGYGSPMLTTLYGVDQFLTVTTTTILGVDAKTGKILWQSDDWKCRIPCSSPAALKDGKVFMSGGYDAGSIMLEVKRSDSGFTAATLFKTMDCNGQIHQPILIGDHLYMNGNDKSKKYGFICMDLHGKLRWETKRDPNFDWGGVLYADGRIYTVDGPAGDLVMIDPDPAGYKEIARAHFLQGDKIWGTIALSNGRLLLRDQTQLKCVDVRGK